MSNFKVPPPYALGHEEPTMQWPRPMLAVSDVERLAKAGVQIKFEDISGQVTPDAPAKVHTPLVQVFWDRWAMAHANDEVHNYGMRRPYQIAAVPYGTKIYVFVAPHDSEPFVLQDEKVLYPSDALMASLAIYEKVKP